VRVAIHQPNYFPWLGYFFKIISADVFIFLDDVQYSKNSYINRVQIKKGSGNRWLTIPVSFHLGERINGIRPAKPHWVQGHIDLLSNNYRGTDYYGEVMPIAKEILESTPDGSIAEINGFIVKKVSALLGIDCRFILSSEIDIEDCTGDDRLVELSRAVAPDALYLSGSGGAKYQEENKFLEAGLGFEYLDFVHPVYDQGMETFIPGRSILDAFFNQGIEGTRKLFCPASK
jgi:hypothetical protein